jgi:hypothetical protein
MTAVERARITLAASKPTHIRAPLQNRRVHRSTSTSLISKDSGLSRMMPANANAKPLRLEEASKPLRLGTFD